MPSSAPDDFLARSPETAAGAQRTVAIHTHGCKLNQADSQTLARQFRDAGYRVVGLADGADIVVLNTCTVTSTADAKARQFLRAARRRNPEAVVVATGCYAQRAPSELESMESVSLVFGNSAKSELVEASHNSLLANNPSPVPTARTGMKSHGRTRATVKIQEGCDQVCAYCIVPKVRGRERSIPLDTIIAEINRHSSEGCKEVTLTGTQLGTYGFDIPGMDLVGLLYRALRETDIERLRVSSLQAHEISEELLELWRDPRLMCHFHIPLQSGTNKILRHMRRRYDTTKFADVVALLRSTYPMVGITTDIIVGFPGETHEDFATSLQIVAAMQFSDIHVFPYSPRPGTSAYYFGQQVPDPEKHERLGKMLALSSDCHRSFRESQLGTVRPVLWQHASRSGYWTGLTDNYVRVRAGGSYSDLGNRITDAKLTGLDGDWVTADVMV